MDNLIGFHICVEKKQFKKCIEKYVNNCNVKKFQLFLSSPKTKRITSIDTNILRETFEYVKSNNIFIVAHSPYVINISSSNEEVIKSNIEYTLNEIETIVKLGGFGSIFHVGKSVKQTYEEGFNNMYKFIKTILNKLKENNINGYFILETGAGCGTEVATTIEELGRLYNMFSDDEKYYFKFCLDTCHLYSAGYDISDVNKCNELIDKIEDNIHWDNVLCIHLNDSKNKCCSKTDRHENFNIGNLSKNKEGIINFINYCIKLQIPMILETPINDNKNVINERNEEIQILKNWITY